jgi:hypothetical protein
LYWLGLVLVGYALAAVVESMVFPVGFAATELKILTADSM